MSETLQLTSTLVIHPDFLICYQLTASLVTTIASNDATKAMFQQMITTEKIKELTTIKKTQDITSKYVLCWAKRTEIQRAQKAMLTDIHEHEDSAWQSTESQ